MQTQDMAENAIKNLNNSLFNGANIVVERGRMKDRKPNQGGPGGNRNDPQILGGGMGGNRGPNPMGGGGFRGKTFFTFNNSKLFIFFLKF